MPLNSRKCESGIYPEWSFHSSKILNAAAICTDDLHLDFKTVNSRQNSENIFIFFHRCSMLHPVVYSLFQPKHSKLRVNVLKLIIKRLISTFSFLGQNILPSILSSVIFYKFPFLNRLSTGNFLNYRFIWM